MECVWVPARRTTKPVAAQPGIGRVPMTCLIFASSKMRNEAGLARIGHGGFVYWRGNMAPTGADRQRDQSGPTLHIVAPSASR